MTKVNSKKDQNLPQQVKLRQKQIEAFYGDSAVGQQIKHFQELTKSIPLEQKSIIVDVGGGIGSFAEELSSKIGAQVRVIDSDKQSIDICNSRKIKNVNAILGDALYPSIVGNENIICFNLILHHLIGANEKKTKELQKQALLSWKKQADYIFINEYIYDSYVNNLSGRLIYKITSSRVLSKIAALISKFVPSLKANTLGVGVRFRSHNEWIDFFKDSGYEVIAKIYGDKDHVSLPRRLLIIKEARKDSFLLKPKLL